jgi:hypothetical protein
MPRPLEPVVSVDGRNGKRKESFAVFPVACLNAISPL